MIEDRLKTKDLVWINITNPKQERLEMLKDEYGFHELDLEDCLSKTESPKIEEYKDYVFAVFHFPLKDIKNNRISIHSLNVFIGNSFLVTLSDGRLRRLGEFYDHLKTSGVEKRKTFKRGSGYLLYLLIDELFDIYTPYISKLHSTIRDIEDDIFEGKVMKDRLYDIMNVKHQIIAFKRALLPHSAIILALEHLHKRFINKQLELYFDDVADKIAQTEQSLISMDETIDTLHKANESLTSHNTNRVMKILTIFSVTMLPLTFLTGLYGMNVALPLAKHPNAFLLLIAGMLSVFGLFMLFFKMKRYL